MSDITTGNFVCIEQTPATIGDRIFARIIDAVVLVAYTYFALFFLDKSGIGDDTFLEVLCVIILFMPIFTYTFLSELLFDGQTLGKYVMKTRVVMADGSSPTSGALLLRFVCEIVDIYMGCMGLVVIMCTKRRQRLGDLAAGTMVIRQEDMSRMRISLSEFDCARRDFRPTYATATKLKPRQADIIRRAVAPDSKISDKRLDVLATKVCRVLALPKDSQPADSADFLRTVLNDYMYLKGRTGVKEV